ncbi:tripartite tricarboxylate transporter substrate binding protein [Zobellella denitrificans]
MGLMKGTIKSFGIAVSIAVLPISALAADNDYPRKKINFIVGYEAGGGTDIMARTIGTYMEMYLEGAKVIVKNVPGAGGLIGFTQTANAKPDGYTIGTFNLPGVMARTHDRKTHYDINSFSYLANIVNDPNVIVVSKSSEINSLNDLVNKAKNTASALTVALSTLGGDDQFTMVYLSKKEGFDFSYIPFKGTAPARTALMGGHVDVAAMNLSEVIGFEDEIKVLAVTAEQRSSLAPYIPTAKEQGYDFVMGSMRGIVGPANLPEEIQEKLIDALTKTYENPEFKKSMEDQGAPLHFVAGEKFKEIAKEQNELAKEIWEESPWIESE